MSKAAQQTIMSTIFSYLGVMLGAFYTLFIVPKLFDSHPENYGALLFLMNYVGLFLIFSSLATPLSIIKFYPIFPTQKRENILSFLLWINVLGLLLSFFIFYLYTENKPILLSIDNQQVNISYFFYPMLISMTLFSFFESYCHALLKIAVPAFLNNTFIRMWMFAILLLYYYDNISFELFTYLYFGQFVASFLLLLGFVWKHKQDHFHLRIRIPENYKEIIKYSLFALPASSAAVLIAKIDIQMIGNLLGEAEVAYYNYAIFFMSVLLIPKNILMQTSRSIISRDFQTQSIVNFTPKYQKISFAFLLSTLVIFLAIFINIEELMKILGSKFGRDSVKYAILILGTGRVIESIFASNHALLEYSKYYKMILVFETSFLIILILLNFILIPRYGLVGAATSSAAIFISNSILKTIYIYKKFKLPLIKSSRIFIGLSITLLGFLYFLPIQQLSFFPTSIYNQIIIIVIRSFIFLLLLLGIAEATGIRKEYYTFKK